MFDSKHIEVGEIQKRLGISGNIISIGGFQFIVVQTRIFAASMRHKAVLGNTLKAQFVTAFEHNEGFPVEPIQTNMRHIFWRDVLNLVDQVYFFEPPLGASRTCKLLSRNGRENLQ